MDAFPEGRLRSGVGGFAVRLKPVFKRVSNCMMKKGLTMNLPIETNDLGKRYGDVKAVEHLSLQVAEGEIYAFLG